MAYHTTDSWGVTEINPPVEMQRALLAELNEAGDADHPDVSLIHDSGWCLTYHKNGNLVLENLGDDEDEEGTVRILRTVDPERVLELWSRLARGQVRALFSEPWESE